MTLDFVRPNLSVCDPLGGHLESFLGSMLPVIFFWKLTRPLQTLRSISSYQILSAIVASVLKLPFQKLSILQLKLFRSNLKSLMAKYSLCPERYTERHSICLHYKTYTRSNTVARKSFSFPLVLLLFCFKMRNFFWLLYLNLNTS